MAVVLESARASDPGVFHRTSCWASPPVSVLGGPEWGMRTCVSSMSPVPLLLAGDHTRRTTSHGPTGRKWKFGGTGGRRRDVTGVQQWWAQA